MENKVYKNSFFIKDSRNYIESNINTAKELINILNKDRLVIISGQRHIGKLNFIKYFLNSINLNNRYFYFDKLNDLENQIQNHLDLNNLLNEYVSLYKKPLIVILKDISEIKGIKTFILNIYKLNYKVIIISNTIKIKGIKEIEILPKKSNNEHISNLIKFGNINDTAFINKISFKEKYIDLIKNDILLYDIFRKKGVKSIILYTYTISYIAKTVRALSLRELHINLNINQNISLKTTIDYVNFSIQAKIIKRIYRYDIKNNKTITSKAKYYFTDNGIRNSFCNFSLNINILIENYIFTLLEYNDYNIYSGINGKFEFSFYGIKSLEKIYIHISKQVSKDELKKEINKLIKIGNNHKKYLLVRNLEQFGIKKLIFDSVEIIEIVQFIKKFS